MKNTENKTADLNISSQKNSFNAPKGHFSSAPSRTFAYREEAVSIRKKSLPLGEAEGALDLPALVSRAKFVWWENWPCTEVESILE